jgi:hypothetical protein
VPLVPLRPKNKKEKRVAGPENLVHSSSSFMIVQNEMLMSEMHDRINEMVIYEEPTDPKNSIDLYEYRCLAKTEELDAIVGLETVSTKPPKHTFEIKRSKREAFITRTVTLIY